MKNLSKLVFSLVILVASLQYGTAQDERALQTEDGEVITLTKDTVEVKMDKDKKKKNKKRFKVLLLDYGMSTYAYEGSINQNEIPSMKLKYPSSFNLNLHIFKHRVNLIDNSLFFEYGLSTNWRRYSFEEDVRLTIAENTVVAQPSTVSYNKNKLRTTYLEVPVMLTIAPKNSKFVLSAGAYGGLRIGSSQKFKSKAEGKEIVRDDFALRDFSTGLVARLGFGPVEFYCQYGLDNMFNDNVSPELVPITFGIALVNF
jgi:hypothetical protein